MRLLTFIGVIEPIQVEPFILPYDVPAHQLVRKPIKAILVVVFDDSTGDSSVVRFVEGAVDRDGPLLHNDRMGVGELVAMAFDTNVDKNMRS